MWRVDVLGKQLKHDFTLNALHRLGKEQAKVLCLFLLKKYPLYAWIKIFLSIPEGERERLPKKGYRYFGELKSKYCHPPGTLEGCWLCGHRPRDRSDFENIVYKNLRSLLSWARQCGMCYFRTMKPELRKVPDAEEDFGLQVFFGDD
jgi:hypothetical protein